MEKSIETESPLSRDHLLPPLTANSTWMGDLKHVIQDKRLHEIVLPGTHNAGSYSCDPFDPAPFAPGISLHWLSRLWCCVSKNFAICQAADVTHQLRSGARYLDIRVCYDERGGILRTEHSLYGSPLRDVLSQVSAFVQTHESEIVIVELKHFRVREFFDMTVDQHKDLVDMIRELFTTDSIIRPDEAKGLTYRELCKRNRNVLIIYNDERRALSCISDPEMPLHRWLTLSSELIVGHWTNSNNVDLLVERLRKFADRQRIAKSEKICVLDACITPDSDIITRGILNCIFCCCWRLCFERCKSPKSLKELAESTHSPLLNLCTDIRVNVVSVDHLVHMESKFGMATKLIELNRTT